ncbi:PDZ domain-containing protein [Paenibacillus sp. PR3]|uniref:PDZ domain-containing protein n=1 Tax=Paenibacillus terricola TaxID=2763503 RepID=A0ABR8N382_9BACL|nr:PDZ domain-containing protein [Paenibacillus terricola]MBD3922632.1 PDZ domain-containing protein [Paenibacillus terricola]
MNITMGRAEAGDMQRTSKVLYVVGLILCFITIIAAELIWIPDPMRWPGGKTWLEMIDLLLYEPSIIALCWAIGAVISLPVSHSISRIVVRVLIILDGALTCWFSWTAPRSIVEWVGLLGVGWLLVMIDLAASERAYRRRNRMRRTPTRSISAIVVQVLLLAIFITPIRYNVTYPGLTMDMNHYAKVEGGTSHSKLTGVLVFDRRAVALDWVLSHWLSTYELSPIPPNQPPLREAYAEVVAMKSEAETTAAAVALQKLGIGKGAVAEGVMITAISKNAPAEGTLKAGDRIVRVAGKETSDVVILSQVMADIKAGSSVQVTYVRGSDTQTALVQTGEAEDADTGSKRAVFGISVQTAYQYDIPRTVDYERPYAHIGGPSHGAMLTLTIIDQLSPEGVTHGWRVAGTGTIEPDGSVGPVGGVMQKAYAVHRTDAEVFFVPASEADEARRGAPAMRIVPVSTIDDILNWLSENKKN